MKIRNGFVSNSSSSSFLIYGIELNSYSQEIYEFLLKHKNYQDKESQKDIEDYCNPESEDYNTGESIEFLDGLNDLELHRGYDEYFFGRRPEYQKDEQTHGDWKKEIKEKLTKICGVDVEPRWQEYCDYDG